MKGTPGITCGSFPRVHIDGGVWHLDVGSSHPGAGEGPKGWAVRPLKRYVSWVQNVVRQFGPYPSWAEDPCGELLLVREDRSERTSSVPVVLPWALWGGNGGGDTPLPIPNREVKPSSSDGTARETGWESRSPPLKNTQSLADSL